MYNMPLCIIWTTNFWLRNAGKNNLLYIVGIDSLEFIADKFKLDLTVVQIFIQFLSTKNENSLNFSKHKIYTSFKAKVKTC